MCDVKGNLIVPYHDYCEQCVGYIFTLIPVTSPCSTNYIVRAELYSSLNPKLLNTHTKVVMSRNTVLVKYPARPS